MGNANDAGRRVQLWNGLLVALFALGLLASLLAVYPRLAYEHGDLRVEVILDGPSIVELARRTDTPVSDVLTRFATIAPLSLALEERLLIDSVLAGYVGFLRAGEVQGVPHLPNWLEGLLDEGGSGSAPLGQGLFRPASAYLIWHTDRIPSELAAQLERRLSRFARRRETIWPDTVIWEVPPLGVATGPDDTPLGLPNPNSVLQLGVGFDPDLVALALDAGFAVSPRPHHRLQFTPDDVRGVLTIVPPDRLGTVVVSGTWIPGYPERVADWAAALVMYDAHVGWIEFARQIGLESVVMRSDYRAVRLHSISAAELRNAPLDVVVARWLRAVRERGIRALYVRPYLDGPAIPAGVDLLTWNEAYLQRVTGELEAAGFSLGTVTPRRLPGVGRSLLIGMFGSVAVAGVWLVRRFASLPLTWEVALLAAEVGGLAALLFVGGWEWTRQIAALGAAVVLPSLAASWALEWAQKGSSGTERWKTWLVSGQALALATVVSLTGALILAGLLSENRFVLGLAQFRGVKVMHVLPPLVVFAALAWGAPVEDLREAFQRIRHALRVRLSVFQLLLLGIMAGFALIIVLRTGSDVLPVPGIERWLRTALEEGFGIRPRTKEIFLGHPAFMLAVWLIRRKVGGPGLRALVAAAGTIGQLSLVNTFAHIHSPLWVSLLRTLYGVFVGLVAGVVLLALAEWGLRRLYAPRAAGDLQ